MDSMELTAKFVLPLRLTVDEFARISRLCPETIRRMIRRREIEAFGTPYLIPRRELLKIGISPGEVTAEHFFLPLAA
jgi:Helix-turn-helix domain